MIEESETASPRRQPKGDKRDRTRARLLEAARTLIRENGYEHTTLEEIAEKAGMTTGAIYGNFKNRNELFIALGQTYWAPIRPQVKMGASFPEIMRAMAEATIAAIPDRSTAAVGRLTGLAYTLTHEELRAKVKATTAESYDVGEQWLRSMIKEEDLPMPADQLVRVLHALIEGLVFQRLLTPELVPDETFRAAFAVLAMNPHRESQRLPNILGVDRR
jgi:AcrR family transcriptional regulator